MNEQLKAEIEANAHTVYEQAKDVVLAMEPSLSAATIAFDMLYREATEALIMADWTDAQRISYANLVGLIVNSKLQAAFTDAVTQCEGLVKPAVTKDTTVILPGASSQVVN